MYFIFLAFLSCNLINPLEFGNFSKSNPSPEFVRSFSSCQKGKGEIGFMAIEGQGDGLRNCRLQGLK